jgi:uncharacterized protein YndB with AHSA1/START domain
MERPFRHPTEKVWRAITEPAHLSAWWPMKIDEIRLELGAPLIFYAEGDFRITGRITELEVGKVIAFADDEGAHANRLELIADGEGCRMVFTHSFAIDQSPAQHASGWHQCFDGLEAVLDGRPVAPMTMDAELMSRYEEALAGPEVRS